MSRFKKYGQLGMQKLLGFFSLLVLGLGFGNIASAQVTTFADSVIGTSGSQAVVPIRANDFTNLIGMQGSIGWDTSVVVYDTVFQYGLPNMSVANFGIAQVVDGRLTFSWDDPNFTGVSVSDSTILFSLRFDVVGNPGDKSPIAFQNSPTQLEFTNSSFSVIPFTTINGEVEVQLGASCAVLGLSAGAQTACDPQTNRYSQDITVTYGNAPGSGSLLVNGQSFPITGSPQSITLTNLVSDGAPVNTTASFSADPTCSRTSAALFNAPASCATFTIFADSVIGTNGSPISVPVRARNLVNLIGAQGSIQWNTSIVTFDTVTTFGLPSMAISNFGITQTGSGLLTFSWDDPTFQGVSVADSTILFQIEFNVIGSPGSQTPVALVNSPTQLEFTNSAFSVIPFNTVNGEVEVQLGAACAVLGISTGSQTACDPQTNRYSQEVTVTYGNAPATGSLLVNGQSFPITSSPQTITLTNLVSDGAPVNVSASFSADPTCSRTESALFTAPASCATFIIFADSVIGVTGNPVSVPVRARNFVNLIGAQGSIQWNTSIVTFDTVTTFGLPNMAISNFGITQTASGLLTFSWDDPTFQGVTVADSTILFQLEFDVVGIPGTQTPIALVNAPTSLEFIDNSFATIGFTSVNGEVDIPLGSNCGILGITAGAQTACDSVSNTYSQDITVTYTNEPATGSLIVNGQNFPIGTSPQTVTLAGLFSDGQPVNVAASFSANAACTQSQTGLFTAPSSCSQFQLFADSVQGATGTQVIVPIRVRSFVDLIGLQGTIEWDITVADLDTVFQFGLPNMSTANFGLGQSANGKLTFSWDDPTFFGVTVPDSTVIFAIRYDVVGGPGSMTPVAFSSTPTQLEVTDNSFSTIGFDTTSGQIEVPIVNCAITDLTAGSQSLCNQFTNTYSQQVTVTYTMAPATGGLIVNGQAFVIGASPQTVTLTGLPSNGLPTNITAYFSADTACFRTENALFNAPFPCISPNVTLFADSVQGNTGSQVIVPVRVRNFSDLIGMQGTVEWNTSIATYDTVFQYGLPSMNVSNFGTALTPSGRLTFSWDDPTLQGVSVPDSTIVFGIRFDVIGSAGTQTPIQFIDSPTFIEFTDNNLQTVPFDTIPGEIEVPLVGLITGTLPSTVFCVGDSVQVPFSFTGFFNLGNVFTAELSDASGSFAAPTVIGTLNDTIGIAVPSVIPAVPSGTGYRIRVTSSNPAIVGSDNGVDLEISNIQVSANASICAGDSILLGGAFQNAAGVYTDTLTAGNGCDSVVTTTLVVFPTFATNDSAQICTGDSFFVGGAFQTTSGSYLDTLNSVNGCDSVVTTQLTVIPAINTNLTADICDGDSIFLGGAFQTVAGSYVDSLIAAGGCDSIVTTVLTVLPVSFDTLAVSICDGDSIFAAGAFQTTGGNYIDTLVAANGCDSILTTALTILPTFSVNDNAQICQGDSIFLGGAFQTLPGSYVDTLQTGAGCDSVVTTNLAVVSTLLASDTIQICDGDSAFISGAFQTMAGNFSDTLVSSAGCDSVLTTTLIVNQNYTVTDSQQICQGDSAFLGGGFQTSAGTFVDTLLSVSGCDSVVTTNLTVLSTLFGTDNVSICDGDSVFLEGAFQSTSGSYVDTLTSTFGCDSVLTTILTVLPNLAVNQNVNICDGDSLFAGGAFQTTSGTYVDTLVGSNGCDSVLTTLLTVLPNSAASQSLTICDGDSILLAGLFQTTSGVYIDTLVSANGCDSVLTSTLTVLPNSADSVSISLCDGDSIFAGGSFQTASGTYIDTLVSNNGCDSILTTVVTVFPVYVIFESADICNGDSIFLGGDFQTAAGSYVDTLISVNGCDSIVTTSLTISPTYQFTVDDTICQGDFYILPGGDTALVSGTYTDSLLTSTGCDSIYVTNLQVNPTFALTQNPAICQGDSFLLPGGGFVGTAGTYIDTLATNAGCDSIITVNLTVNPTFNLTQSISICDGDSLQLPGGAFVDSAGVFSDTLQTNAGCDSVVVTTVSILPTFQQGQSVTICDGDFVILPGGDTATVAGMYVDSLLTGAGCDSIITTTLTVNPTFAVAVTDSICDGDSYTLPGGTVVVIGGTYLDTLTTQNGCDSIITTNLTVNPVYNQAVNADICQGDSFALPGGSFVNTAGIYTDSLTSSLGCDSVIVTTLVVNPTFFQNVNAVICDGDSLILPGGGVATMAGSYTDSLTTGNGCDSIIVTTVSVNPTYFQTLNPEICDGDSFQLPSGVFVNTGGIYLDTLATVDGCDSIFSVSLIVNPTFNQSQTVNLCQGDSVVLPGGGVVNTSGTFSDTLMTSSGCDSIINTTVIVSPVFNQSNSIAICDGDSFTLPGGGVVTLAGVYTDSLTSSAGCDSVIITTVTVNPTFAVAVFDTICQGDSYLLPGGGTATTTGIYNDTLGTVNGCDSVITTNLTVNPSYNIPIAADICDGDSYTLPGGSVVTTSGTYSDTLATNLGCDSIIVTTLTVNPVYNQSVSADICDGDTFTLPGGGTATVAGMYTDSLLTAAGCDSVIITTLTVNPTFNQAVSASICSNEDYTLPGGTVVTTAGVYNDTLSTSLGCDSVIVTTLTVETAYSATVVDSICDGDSYTLPGGAVVTTTGIYIDSLTAVNGCDSIIETDLTVTVLDTGLTLLVNTLTSEQNNATYQWIDCGVGGGPIPGATQQSFTPTANGVYAVEITQGLCSDTSACTTVVVIGLTESDFSSQLSVYPNPGAGHFWLDLGQQFMDVEVWVTDARGRRVFEQHTEGVQEMVLDLESLSDGMYFIGVRADGQTGAAKVLLRR